MEVKCPECSATIDTKDVIIAKKKKIKIYKKGNPMKKIFREIGFIEMGELPKVEFYNNLVLRSHVALILSLVALGLALAKIVT